MEALNFLKFWKPTIPFPTPVIEFKNDVVNNEEEEEDSFFDLEITSPKYDKKENDTVITTPPKQSPNDDKITTEQAYTPNDSIPKRKILPLEPSPKPQSPIALLKSAPNLRAFSFKKPKSAERARESAARRFTAVESPRSAKPQQQKQPERLSSRDVIQKYLKLVKPLYVKASRRYGNDKPSDSAHFASPSSSPASFTAKDRSVPAGIRVVCNQLGKSKSTTMTTTTTTSSLPSFRGVQTTSSSLSCSRRDDSLLLQHDGIQSAILHCKKSFNSSRDSCSLSRSTSDSSSMKSYSTDSYRISNSASETSHDNSARNSIEDGRCDNNIH